MPQSAAKTSQLTSAISADPRWNAAPEERARSAAASLAEATRILAKLDAPEAVMERIPELALRCCFAFAAALLHVDDAAAEVLARSGAAFETLAADVRREARALVQGGRSGEVRSLGPLAVFVLPGDEHGLVLAVERSIESRPAGGVDPLVAYGVLVSAALARARACAELGEACSREAAVVEAMREGVLAVDQNGVVRALNSAGASALGIRRETALGRRLRDMPGFSTLATALTLPESGPACVVTLPRGEVAVRVHRHERGAVATIRDVAAEDVSPQRTVGSVARYTFEHLVGISPALHDVIAKARRAAENDTPILLVGESGTGKEMLAQAIHDASPRASEPFLAINVAAIPSELLESELFGYEGGTFTGARAAGRAGKIELAGRGTLLLDEIGDMPAEMQAKLLRVLQERVVQRLGSARDIQVRARIIATTNRDLAKDVAAGNFRLDLYHRLRVIQLSLPPLRDRPGDVPLLVADRLRAHAERTGRRVEIAPHVLEAFEASDWPGNVRELVNVLDGALGILPAGETVLSHVPPALEGPAAPRPRAIGPHEVLPLEEIERRACEETLAAFGGNVKQAAKALGLARQTLYAKMKRYGIGSGSAGAAASEGDAGDPPAQPPPERR